MAAYVIFDILSVHPEQMTGYGDKAIASLEAHGGKIIAGHEALIAIVQGIGPVYAGKLREAGIRSGSSSLSSRRWSGPKPGTSRRNTKRCCRFDSRHIVTRW